ncbi:MAG: hypothetical protein C0475_08960 [Planctomyces sp.]|nr:hypothetical protein [Planctomyces sp.]
MTGSRTVWPVVAVTVVWAAALGLPLAGAPPAAAAVASAVVAAAAAVWLAARERLRALRLARLSHKAKLLLTTTLPDPPQAPAPPAPPTPPAPTTPPDPDPTTDELADLRDTLDALRRRLTSQIKELAKKSRNLEALIDGMTEPVLATGSHDQVLLCNRAAEALYQARPGGLIGRPIREIFTRPDVLALHSKALSGHVAQLQVPITTPIGVRTYQVSASPVPAAWGPGVFGAILVLRDVTELAQAVHIKTDFVANASHELRTPVAALRIALDTLTDGAADDQAMRARLLNVCLNHVHRLEEMIRDLMDLSRVESPDTPVHIHDVSVPELEASMRLIFEPICAQRHLRLRFALEPDALSVPTDPRLLALIVRNLIDNATKFAFPDTEILLRARRTHSAYRFEVIDRGQGIPLALQERVFERFYQVDAARTGASGGLTSPPPPPPPHHTNTTHAPHAPRTPAPAAPHQASTARRGSGLGLSIVKHACKALGGKIGLQSVWGEGTTVWFELPLTPAEGSTHTHVISHTGNHAGAHNHSQPHNHPGNGQPQPGP